MTRLSPPIDSDFHCSDAALLVCEARDRTLLEDERESLDRHLQDCQYCQVTKRQFASLFGQLDTLLGKGERGK
jgi:hypothetical protein